MALVVAIGVTIGLAGALASARQRGLLRPVRETFALADDDLVWNCGFKLRRPTTAVATFGFAQVHLRDDLMCVRSVGMRHSAYCVRRSEARIEVRRIQGVRGMRVLGEKIDFDLAVGGLPSLIERLNELGWAVDATG